MSDKDTTTTTFKSVACSRRKKQAAFAAVLLAILLVTVVICVLSIVTLSFPPEEGIGERLSETTIPYRYKLSMRPYIGAGKFEGNVSIVLYIIKQKRWIYLHWKNLTIISTTLSQGNNFFKISEWFELPNEMWMIQTEKSLETGIYNLSIGFTGNLGEETGFFSANYNESGKIKSYAATVFSPNFARTAFPCFDEPHLKAKFQITLIHENTHPVAVSNMPKKSECRFENGWTETSFEESIRLSTYLVAFTVCDFVNVVANTSTNNLQYSIWAPRDKIAETKYAQSVISSALPFLETYLGIPYSDFGIGKLDMFSLPIHKYLGMENPGLVNFHQANFCYNESSSTPQQQFEIFKLIIHELSHFWFGNLVTMKFWDEVWLKEGFANLIPVLKDLAHLSPHKDTDSDFRARIAFTSLAKDVSPGFYPLKKDPYNPNTIFNSAYEKGSSVLRMLEGFMEAQRTGSFRKALMFYLSQNRGKSVTSEDLWNAFEEFSGITKLNDLMRVWTEERGFPLLTYDSENETLRQDWFNPMNLLKTPKTWQTPVTLFSSTNRTTRTLILGANTVHVAKGGRWVKINADGKGYYRVNYDEGNWNKIILQLHADNTAFSLSDRVQLIDDAISLAKYAKLSYRTPLTLLSCLETENNWPAWAQVVQYHYFNIKLLLGTSIVAESFDKYISELIPPDKEGTDNNSKRLNSLFQELRRFTESNGTYFEETVKEKETMIENFFENSDSGLRRESDITNYVSNLFTTVQQLKKLELYYKSKPNASESVKTMRETAVSLVKHNIAWKETRLSDFTQALASLIK